MNARRPPPTLVDPLLTIESVAKHLSVATGTALRLCQEAGIVRVVTVSGLKRPLRRVLWSEVVSAFQAEASTAARAPSDDWEAAVAERLSRSPRRLRRAGE